MNNHRNWLLTLKHVVRSFWGILSNNLGLKLLSVLFAMFLWSYVITSSPTITREKTLSGVDVVVSGQSVLSSRDLAVLTDVSDLTDARVRVRVSQSLFAQATSENVRVELDLSGVRSAGKQSVKLRGISTYGSVVQMWPEYVDLEIENRDQRYVPVNSELKGTNPNYWYNVSRINPSQIAVTGPTSAVQQASYALVSLDMSGRTESHSRIESCVVLDAQGNELPDSLSRSSKSATVNVEIYPARSLEIATALEDLLTGQAAEGYHVAGVEVSPASVMVAGEQTLLDSLTKLSVEPIDLSRRNQTFTAIAKVSALKGVRHLSSEEVSVTVIIAQDAA